MFFICVNLDIIRIDCRKVLNMENIVQHITKSPLKHTTIVIVALIFILYIFFDGTSIENGHSTVSGNGNENENYPNKREYRHNCMKLFKKLRNPDPKLIIRPPPKIPPPEMLNDFIDNGKMPITRSFYFDDAYSDSMTNKIEISNKIPVIPKSDIDTAVKQAINNENTNYYSDFFMRRSMFEYRKNLEKKTFAVFGTILPWVESIAYACGSSKIFTFDYTRKEYPDEYKSRMEWLHVFDFFDDAIENEKIENYDNAGSFSSIGLYFYILTLILYILTLL